LAGRAKEDVVHTVEVTPATLYEAVALGLKQIRGMYFTLIPLRPEVTRDAPILDAILAGQGQLG